MTVERRLIAVLLFALAVSGAGCESDPPPSPAPSSIFAGTWVGTFADGAVGQVQMTFSLAADPVAAGGTWSAVITGQAVGGSVLAISVVENGTVRYLFSGACAGGGFLNVQPIFAGTRMTGTYGAVGCSGLTSGTVDLVRQ